MLGDEHGEQELLDLGVTRLPIGQNLAHEVHKALYFESASLLPSLNDQGSTDHLCCGHDVV